MTPKSLYEDRIRELAPDYDPRHVEAFMRVGHGTLDHLSGEAFRMEVEISCACVDNVGVDEAEKTAISMGFPPKEQSSIRLPAAPSGPDQDEEYFQGPGM